jgi:hypothetical protein
VTIVCLPLTWQNNSNIVFLRKRDKSFGILTNEDDDGMTLDFNGKIERRTRSDVTISKHLLPFDTKTMKGDLKYSTVTVTDTQGGTRAAEIKQIDPHNALGFAFVVEYIDGETETVPISRIKYRSTHGNKRQKVADATPVAPIRSPTSPTTVTYILEFTGRTGDDFNMVGIDATATFTTRPNYDCNTVDDSDYLEVLSSLVIHSAPVAAAAIRMTQFNRLRVYEDRAGRRRWQGGYRDGRTEPVTADWVKENFKHWFISRVESHMGIGDGWCFVPVGRMDSTAPQSVAANLNGMFGFGTQGPELTPEVRYRSAKDGGDFCLPYSAASAAHHLGDAKLSSLFKQEASNIEGHERQMETVREMANQQGWTTHKIASVEKIAAFNPLTACPDGDMLIMHLKETDGAADHAVTIALGWIFDANRTHALPLSSDGLKAINYAGIVSATRLTPKPKVAAALAKKRKACADV